MCTSNLMNILNMFYKSFIKSIIYVLIICWYFNLIIKNKNSLQKFACVSSRIIGNNQRDITQFCEQRVLVKICSVLVNESHVIYPMFMTLPLGRYFRCPICKTNYKKLYFIPVAIGHVNNVKWMYFIYIFLYRFCIAYTMSIQKTM